MERRALPEDDGGNRIHLQSYHTSSFSAAAAYPSFIRWLDNETLLNSQSTSLDNHNSERRNLRTPISYSSSSSISQENEQERKIRKPRVFLLDTHEAIRNISIWNWNWNWQEGKIYESTPKKKKQTTKHRRRPSNFVESPKWEDPPKTMRLHNSMKDETYPFGGSLPDWPMQQEVNLKTTKGFHKRRYNSDDPFARSLNWATTENPDGVSLVHDAIDQGACGSCWAYAATGSLETSLARVAAQSAYRTALQENATDPYSFATSIEDQVFQQHRLSIQELLDCDTSMIDQGCVGGNPLVAFYYIEKKGLLSWEDYPYRAKEADTCLRDHDSNPFTDGNVSVSAEPVATVDAWGILPTDHEDMIQVALRYIGPVAAAINAADPDFISYSHGIFDKISCDQEPNHAVLIVGYGEEVKTALDGSEQTRKYWIARNSWGTSWGENGFIRILRGPGYKKMPGICGIARSPSIALGGRLLGSPWSPPPPPPPTQDSSYKDQMSGRSLDDDFFPVDHGVVEANLVHFCDTIVAPNTFTHVGCLRLGRTFNQHRASSLAAFSFLVVLLLCWFLTYPCRQMDEKRRRRRLMMQEEERRKHRGAQTGQTESLVLNHPIHDSGNDSNAETDTVEGGHFIIDENGGEDHDSLELSSVDETEDLRCRHLDDQDETQIHYPQLAQTSPTSESSRLLPRYNGASLYGSLFLPSNPELGHSDEKNGRLVNGQQSRNNFFNLMSASTKASGSSWFFQQG